MAADPLNWTVEIFKLCGIAIAAFIGAWLAAQFALSRFYREKVWERKTEAYTAIFDAFHDMDRWLYDRAAHSGPESPEPDEKLIHAYRNAVENLKRRLANETWLIPDHIRDRIDQTLLQIDSLGGGGGPYGPRLFMHGAAIIRSTVHDLRDSVRTDLRLPGVKRFSAIIFVYWATVFIGSIVGAIIIISAHKAH